MLLENNLCSCAGSQSSLGQRTPCAQHMSGDAKKGAWTPEEDEALKRLVLVALLLQLFFTLSADLSAFLLLFTLFASL